MKWLHLAYNILAVNAAVCGVLVITVAVVKIRDRTTETWNRWQRVQDINSTTKGN
jgi:hypothetical protein